ncbi:hydrogenase maturation nickel metallochaperone HypA [Actinomadura craniellae]|uniref:Hydrogenase maturation factor HypA n=1 Tax=Actinomadura craniellae TaxID=2231787 RepID=A0A365H9D2_9ACTN|nr:hydrogenase maturation nickel metallochaperone HypA [Actinomadura craniellae]RAY15705.1 hydrogenase maturation nickel metallochaperone HypA [Actinomadura craniellae]
MHELGICEPLVTAVEESAAGRTVTGVRVRVGALHAVAPDAFDQAFTVAARGTVAEGAEIDLVVVPALVCCAECGARTEAAEPHPACPVCGSSNAEVSGGDDLVLESIRVREVAADVPGDPR